MRQLHVLLTTLVITLLLATATPAVAQTRPNPPGLRPGNHRLSMTVDGRERAYILHVPPQARSTTPLPLLVVLHGTYGSGRKMQFGLGFDPYADQRGFMVAYPDAYQGMRWNDGRGTLDSTRAGVDDVRFLTQMVDAIATHGRLDRTQVYVTGASNGGMMAYRLGCETSGVFTGIAPVIANIPAPIAESCAPQVPLSVLSINGDADPFIPFNGGQVCADVRYGCEKGFVIATDASLERFALASGCADRTQVTTLPPTVGDGTSVELHRYPGCVGGAQVQLYVVRGGGHVWPPRSPQTPSAGTASANLDATRTITDFFLPAR